MLLDEIIKYKKQEVEKRKQTLPLKNLIAQIQSKSFPLKKSFKQAIQKKDKINLIAEIKKRSPSKGVLNQKLDILEIAKIYEDSGIAAISVLTDEKFFHGSLEDLKKVSEYVKIPCLCKDFIIDSYQIYEAKLYGASAFLLIVKVLTKQEIIDFLKKGQELGLDALVEVHDLPDLDKILDVPIDILGINNRSLKDLSIDINRSLDLQKHLKKGYILISESGVEKRSDILMMQDAGFDAVLIGTTLMESKNIITKIKELNGYV